MSTLAANAVSISISKKRIVSDATCDVRPGEICGLVGPNGAGKSTLLRAMCRLLSLESGKVTLGDVDAATMPQRDFAKRVAYLPQSTIVHWRLDVASLVGLGRLPHRGAFTAPSAEDRRAIDAAMARADVAEFANRSADTLSGGERARAMLARVLAVESEIILADEPVASLDPYHALHVMELLRDLAREGRAVLVVLHDLTLAMRFCDRLVLMHQGRIAADGAPAEVLAVAPLAATYGIESCYGSFEGESYLVPWRRRQTAPEASC